MGIFDKLKFWKKPGLEPLGAGSDAGLPPLGPDLSLPDSGLGSNFGGDNALAPNPEPDFGPVEDFNAHPAYPTQKGMNRGFSPTPSGPSFLDKDIQIISSKLDTIKAEIESMSQRIIKIERIAEQGLETRKRPPTMKELGW